MNRSNGRSRSGAKSNVRRGLMEKQLYVNGEWIGSDLEKIEVYNPATGEIVGVIPNAGKKETRAAIDAALG